MCNFPLRQTNTLGRATPKRSRFDFGWVKQQPRSTVARSQSRASSERSDVTNPGTVPMRLRFARTTVIAGRVPGAFGRSARPLPQDWRCVVPYVRNGGDGRGGAPARRRSKRNLLELFGDGQSCPCVHCGAPLTFETLQRDRVVPPRYSHPLAGSYSLANLQPSCGDCNKRRSNRTCEPAPLALAIMAQRASQFAAVRTQTSVAF